MCGRVMKVVIANAPLAYLDVGALMIKRIRHKMDSLAVPGNGLAPSIQVHQPVVEISDRLKSINDQGGTETPSLNVQSLYIPQGESGVPQKEPLPVGGNAVQLAATTDVHADKTKKVVATAYVGSLALVLGCCAYKCCCEESAEDAEKRRRKERPALLKKYKEENIKKILEHGDGRRDKATLERMSSEELECLLADLRCSKPKPGSKTNLTTKQKHRSESAAPLIDAATSAATRAADVAQDVDDTVQTVQALASVQAPGEMGAPEECGCRCCCCE